jgi:hypothetical protein
MAMARPAQPTEPKTGPRGILCPYCGQVSMNPKRCDACAGFFDPLSRQASQNAMGPWFIRDGKGPFRPGCSFETVRELVKRGKITRETVLRGPTTRQFWNFAGRTPTVANLLGHCHNCGGEVSPEDYSCAACGAVFTPDTDRQHMGLAPVHLLPGQAAPEIIAAASGAPERKPAKRASVEKAGALAAAPRARSRGRTLAMLVLVAAVIVSAGVVAAVAGWPEETAHIWRRMTGAQETSSSRTSNQAHASSPAGEKPASQAAPSPAAAGESAAPDPSEPPKHEEPARPPEPPKPEPKAEGLDELGVVRVALAAEGEIDEKALLSKLEAIKRRDSSATAEADALAELVKKRAEQAKLKKLP